MARALALALCLSSAAAFAPAARSPARVAPRMAEESSVSRRELGQAIAAALGTTGFAAAASATAGASPKFSVFGFGADIDTVSEGAFYNSDLNRPTYSPYSPFAQTGTGVYVKNNPEEIKFQKQMFENTKKEIVKSEAFIADKKWEEVRSLYERRMYNMRNSMNYLASVSSNPTASTKAAKKFYASMEDTGLKSKRKQQAAAKVAYTKMMDDLAKYEATI